MRLFLLCAALTAAGFLGCGGDDDSSDSNVLHLSSGDYTEDELREQVRAAFTRDAPSPQSICPDLRGLSVAEATDLLLDVQPSTTPVQTPVRADQERYTEIMLEECERLGF